MYTWKRAVENAKNVLRFNTPYFYLIIIFALGKTWNQKQTHTQKKQKYLMLYSTASLMIFSMHLEDTWDSSAIAAREMNVLCVPEDSAVQESEASIDSSEHSNANWTMFSQFSFRIKSKPLISQYLRLFNALSFTQFNHDD